MGSHRTTRPVPITRLLVSCSDRPGIISAVAKFLYERGANIVRSDQYSSDAEGGDFFLRIEFTHPSEGRESLQQDFGLSVAEPLGMTWRMWNAEKPKRLAVMVSRYDHCLQDLLWRWRRKELEAEIVAVISNHQDFRQDVESFGVEFHHIPVEKGRKPEAEARLLEVLEGKCDVVVLARYMQVLSGDLLVRLRLPVINIHHSFLPAFVGAGPYERAKERGVKLVGATAHYVTEELDEGPIIEQDVVRISHRDDVSTLQRLGADVERIVLARAVQWHCEDRVIRHRNTTVVF